MNDLSWIEIVFMMQVICSLLMVTWLYKSSRTKIKVEEEEEDKNFLVIDKKLIQKERKKGLNQIQIARKYGVGKNSISEIKLGKKEPIRIRLN